MLSLGTTLIESSLWERLVGGSVIPTPMNSPCIFWKGLYIKPHLLILLFYVYCWEYYTHQQNCKSFKYKLIVCQIILFLEISTLDYFQAIILIIVMICCKKRSFRTDRVTATHITQHPYQCGSSAHHSFSFDSFHQAITVTWSSCNNYLIIFWQHSKQNV